MSADLDLWNYLERREEEIVQKRASLKRELEDLRSVRSTLEHRQRSAGERDATEKLTIKEMVRAVLERNPEGGSSDEIVSWINKTFGRELARPSLTPQLSRLKSDGEVDLDEDTGTWALSIFRERRIGSIKANPSRHDIRMERENLERIHRLGGGTKRL